MEGFELMKQGAEGRIYKGYYLGKLVIAKERFIKKYRHKTLDNRLSKERIKSECRAILRCKSVGIRTPALYLVDFQRRIIFMEFIDNSITVKDFLLTTPDSVPDLALKIGEILGHMHANDIIHGDLTTSNILIRKSSKKQLDLVFIDFGLSHIDNSVEDKGVDLYVLERALRSTHVGADQIFDSILKGYRNSNNPQWKEVFVKLEDVRARGRKRTMVG